MRVLTTKMMLLRHALFAFLVLALQSPDGGPNQSTHRVSMTVAAIPNQQGPTNAPVALRNIFANQASSAVVPRAKARPTVRPTRRRRPPPPLPPTRKPPTRRPTPAPVRRTPKPTEKPTKRPNRRRPAPPPPTPHRPTSSPTKRPTLAPFVIASDVPKPTLPPLKILVQKGIAMVLDGGLLLDDTSVTAWKRATGNRIANETLTSIPSATNLTVIVDLRNQATSVRRLTHESSMGEDNRGRRELLSGVVLTFDVTISFISTSSVITPPNVIVDEAFGTTTKKRLFIADLHAANTAALNGVTAVGVFVPLPTPSPTPVPTAPPTPPPTRPPTPAPTLPPTKLPTLPPTGAPTPVPLRSSTEKGVTMVLANGVLLGGASLAAWQSATEGQIANQTAIAMPNATNVTVTVNVTNQNLGSNLRRKVLAEEGQDRRELLTGLVITFDVTIRFIVLNPSQIVGADTIVDDAFGQSQQRRQFLNTLHATGLPELVVVAGVGVIIALPTPSPTLYPTSQPTPLPTRPPSASPTLFPTKLPTLPPTASPTPALFKTLTEKGISMVLYGGVSLAGPSLAAWQNTTAIQIATEIALDMPNATNVNVTVNLALQTTTSNLRRALMVDYVDYPERHRELLPGLLILFDVTVTFRVVASVPIIGLGTTVRKAFDSGAKRDQFVAGVHASNTSELAGVYDVSVSVAPPTPSPTSSPTTHPTPFPTQQPSLPPTPLPTKLPTPLPTSSPTPVPLLSFTEKGVKMVLFGATNLTGASLAAWQNATAMQILNETAAEMPKAFNIKVFVTLTSQTTSRRRVQADADFGGPGRTLAASVNLVTFDVAASFNLMPSAVLVDLATIIKNAFKTDAKLAQFIASLLALKTSELAGVYDVSLSVPLPTPSPTSTPTARPTPVPPTLPPSLRPTLFPTLALIIPPTSSPTGKPTTSPTSKPTLSPTGRPTSSPTGKPTASPTKKPTSKPTAKPTAPTMSPSRSQHPSRHPSHNPSITSHPSRLPSRHPSHHPSRTNHPSRTPSQHPSHDPSSSSHPSHHPSKTNHPSRTPSISPTDTSVPSPSPSHHPSKRPA